MLINAKDNFGSNIFVTLIILLIKLFISYIRYYFLTAAIIFPLVGLLLIILTLNPNFSFNFLEYFSFLNQSYKYKTESFSLGIKEVMQIISVITLFLWLIISVIKLVIKKVFKINTNVSSNFKILSFFVVITLIYIVDLIFIAISDTLDNGFYFIFIFFYILNLAYVSGYFLLEALLNKFSGYGVE